jgi:hypothetical protein
MPSCPEHEANLLLRPFSRTSAGGQLFNRLQCVGYVPHLPFGSVGRLGTPTGRRTSPRRRRG